MRMPRGGLRAPPNFRCVHASLYLSAQTATREIMAATTVDELVAARQDLGDALTGAVRGSKSSACRLSASS